VRARPALLLTHTLSPEKPAHTPSSSRSSDPRLTHGERVVSAGAVLSLTFPLLLLFFFFTHSELLRREEFILC
jgi:hypothetical protein